MIRGGGRYAIHFCLKKPVCISSTNARPKKKSANLSNCNASLKCRRNLNTFPSVQLHAWNTNQVTLSVTKTKTRKKSTTVNCPLKVRHFLGIFMNSKISEKIRLQILHFLEQGLRSQVIASRLHLCRSTVIQWQHAFDRGDFR